MRATFRGSVRALSAALALGLTATLLPTTTVAAAPSAEADDVVALEAASPVPVRDLAPVAADKLVAAPRSRFVELDVDALVAQLAEPEVTIRLFADVAVPLRADGPVTGGALGTLTWSGSAPDGYASLTIAEDGVRGDITHDGVRYDIAPAGDDGRHLVTVEARDFPDEIEAHVPDTTAAGETVAPATDADTPLGAAAENAADGATIRVLTWYDTNARTYFGGTDQLAQNELAATINEANQAYARSGITQTIESAAIEYVNYSAVVDANTALNRVTQPSDGQIDAIHTRRNQVGADLVALVSPITDACGIAWLSTNVAIGGDAYGFSVTAPNCARGNLSYVHELGHNMGAGHGGGNGSGTFSYSNGYRDATHGFRTIMAYDSGGCCPRVAHFSSPTVKYTTWATGSASEDNARTLNTTATTVAGYRDDPTPPPANDAFASATAWNPAMGNPVTGTNAGATKQSGEPNHAGVIGGKSVWWKYTPATPQLVSVSTAGSNFNTLLAVYTGASVNALTQIAANDDAAANTTRSKLDFLASAGTTYYLAVDGFAGATGTVAMTIAVADPGGDWFTPLTPARIQDSRPAGPKVGPYGTPWGAGTARTVQATGVGGVPSGATAVTLNVTVTNTSGSSFLTVWPTGQTRPLASSLNWTPGRTVANAVTVKVGTGGKISVFNAGGNADVIIDVVGYYDDGGAAGFTSLSPARIQDSRPAGPKVGPYGTPWGAGTARTVQATGVGGVPSGATAVTLNVTVTNASASSFLTVWPTGQTRPLASSLNWTPGRTVANAVTVKVGTGGKISVFNAGGNADVIIDVVGYFTNGSGAAFHPAAPVRIQDSRLGGPKVGPYGTPWGAGTARTVQTGSVAGVPGNAAAALLNVTVTNGTASSFLTAWPTGQTRPLASSLNWTQGLTVPNAVTVKLGTKGMVSYFNASGAVDVIADVAGWYG